METNLLQSFESSFESHLFIPQLIDAGLQLLPRLQHLFVQHIFGSEFVRLVHDELQCGIFQNDVDVHLRLFVVLGGSAALHFELLMVEKDKIEKLKIPRQIVTESLPDEC